MIEANEINFETEILSTSMTTPVLVDFWSPSCTPCKTLKPILEKLETEYAGRFLLATVNSDEQRQLASMFGIRSVPTCILIKNGQPVDGFMGALPEPQVREFLDKHIGAPELVEDQIEEPAAEDLDDAALLERLQNVVRAEPENDNAVFDLVRLLLQMGKIDDARQVFAAVATKAAGVRLFDSLQRWLDAIDAAPTADIPQLDAAIAADKRNFEARFARAQALMAQQQFTQALDELLEILMRDKAWNEELARKTYVAILDIIEPPKPAVAEGQIPPEDETVASYRRRLSSVILS